MTAVAPHRRSRPILSLPNDWRANPVALIKAATVVNVVVTAIALLLLCGISEDWWFSAALSYLPRAPYLAFSLPIIPAIGRRQWLPASINGLCGVLIAGPVMGLCAPLTLKSPPPPSQSLMVVSCNIDNGDSDLAQVLAEIDALNPDVIALQEIREGGDDFTRHFADWHSIHVGEYWVAARFPVRLVDQCDAEAMQRTTAIACEIEAPGGTWLLCDIHLSTARHGLTQLRWHSPLTGAGVDDLRWRQWERQLESEETLKFVASHAGRPMIALGDFNTPTTSSLFAGVWGEWQSAFETVGWGYGFTSPCNTTRLWPHNTPWLRIDHILCDPHWQIHEAGIGHTAGSDHRLVWARVSLRR
ncbi:MAG: endonuclease/exonuclease/phosphatase family protein [Planctomycetaceae bacterium]|nr:endonuclease/exonuclease/phosphatase family protein [Planctomycetaceae bacterium]